jgi:uncharacterized repeat protein (TIGR03803 family)
MRNSHRSQGTRAFSMNRTAEMKRFGALTLCVVFASCGRVANPGIVPAAPAPGVGPDRASGYKTIFSFDGADGSDPDVTLISVKGQLYGTTSNGGDWSTGGGTVFAVTTAGHERVLHSFGKGKDGRSPAAELTILNGTFYGTTQYGGKYGEGTVFTVDAAGHERVLHSFGKGDDGKQPLSGLTVLNGLLYGTTSAGGSKYDGTVYSITPTGAEHVIYAFNGMSGGADSPRAGLTVVKGTLYGTTFGGGCINNGAVFSVTTSGKESTLYRFGCNSNYNDGENPVAKLVAVKNTLYGTTFDGGRPGYGTVFSVTTGGRENVLYTFGGGSDGQTPESSLVYKSGTLFGTTIEGGADDKGVVFSVTLSGTERVLYSFGALPDGENPYAGLTYLKGTLYGTTANGGNGRYGGGTVYKIAP